LLIINILQPENEYTDAEPNVHGGFPNYEYFQYVEDQFRNAGIVVPFISNGMILPMKSVLTELTEIDAGPDGHDSPYLTKEGAVDIYGHDGKILEFVH